MKTIVFIETNFSGLYAIDYCRHQNYKSVLITDSFERFEKWFPESVLGKLEQVNQLIKVNDSSNVEEVLQAIKDQVPEVDAVLTFAEIRTKTAAKICRELGLRGSHLEAIEIAQDKYRFRKVLQDKYVERVGCIKVNADEIDSLESANIKFPCFIKPVNGHSSIGAAVCRNVSDIKNVMNLLKKTDEDCVSSSVVIEDFLEGQLVSVEILTTARGQHQIVGISDRDIVNDSVETGSSFPLRHRDKDLIEKMACAALDAIGYDFGASHVELIVTKTGPHLVEVNTRVGGSGHSVMLDLATSRSIVGDCIELNLGQLNLSDKLYNHEQGAAWKCFVSQKGGLIRKLPTLASVKKQIGVTDVWFHHQVGDTVQALNSNFNWIVQVMCTGLDQVDAKNNANLAIEYIAQNTVIE